MFSGRLRIRGSRNGLRYYRLVLGRKCDLSTQIPKRKKAVSKAEAGMGRLFCAFRPDMKEASRDGRHSGRTNAFELIV